ncbi:MAG: hypothetical protein ABIJ50_08415 [Pseudomonadota bacterium]
MASVTTLPNWHQSENAFGELESIDNAGATISTRLMVALLSLKFTFDLSDEVVLEKQVENPSWQH